MEMIMQYVWQHRLWPTRGLTTVDGRRLRVIDPGQLNTGAGPDFFNAKIELDGEMWAGNVEIHDRASDWARHGHHNDRAYDTVILHVVHRDDTQVRRPTGAVIPQVVMPDAEVIRERYLKLKGAPPAELPCARTIAAMEPIYLTDWISSLGFERLYAKSERLCQLVDRLNGDWEEAAYVTLARAMGFGTNSEPFERLALRVPLKVLRKHNDSVESIEAMLFGQANLLDHNDEYCTRLATEYTFLAHKYSLTPLDAGVWRLGRMRPWNFPHRRIATLARFIHSHYGLMMTFNAVQSLDDAAALFDFKLDGYWSGHHRFGAGGATTERALSKSATTLLMINAIIPLIHAYAMSRSDHRRANMAAEMLQELPAEHNTIIAMFGSAGIKATDAFTSQALIQLRREYCEPRKCIYCRIGHRHLCSH